VTATLRDILAGSPVSLVARAVAAGDDGAPPMTVWQLTH
jgi:hypothetical protein